MIKELVKLASHLDGNGYAKEADYLDEIITKMSQDMGEEDAGMMLEGLEDLLGPLDDELQGIEEGDDSVGEVPNLFDELKDEEILFDEGSELSALIGEDIDDETLDDMDLSALSKGISNDPAGMAEYVLNNLDEDVDMSNLMQFAQALQSAPAAAEDSLE